MPERSLITAESVAVPTTQAVLPQPVRAAIIQANNDQSDPLSLFVYDLTALERHIKAVMAQLPDGVELFYAIKANSEPEILNTLAPWVNGFEISSGGEIGSLAQCHTRLPFVFSGPGKLDSELEAALQHDVAAVHVESLSEIVRLQQQARYLGRVQPVFIRINPSLPVELTSRLTMAGRATPFGMDESELAQAVAAVDQASHLQLQGFHVHAMSHQKVLARHQQLLDFYLQRWPQWRALAAEPDQVTHLNVGGGIGVNYTSDEQFDWSGFCLWLKERLDNMDQRPVLRFEPGRFITAFCGYYVMQVLDKKVSHGEHFLICRGGTHQFRLPAAQSHDHPVIHWPKPLQGGQPVSQINEESSQRWTLVGQLCTPKDILSRQCMLQEVAVDDLLILPLAGAYGYNISHADFLCHPRPQQRYVMAEQGLKETVTCD